jgi:ketosteroid isomerase-like protein
MSAPAPNAQPILDALISLADAFNAHDLDRIMNHFAEDAVLEMPRGKDSWGARFVGKTAVREGLAGRFKRMPDVHYGDETHFVAGDTGISKWTVTEDESGGKKDPGEWLRFLYISCRAGREEGLLLEDSQRTEIELLLLGGGRNRLARTQSSPGILAPFVRVLRIRCEDPRVFSLG